MVADLRGKLVVDLQGKLAVDLQGKLAADLQGKLADLDLQGTGWWSWTCRGRAGGLAGKDFWLS